MGSVQEEQIKQQSVSTAVSDKKKKKKPTKIVIGMGIDDGKMTARSQISTKSANSNRKPQFSRFSSSDGNHRSKHNSYNRTNEGNRSTKSSPHANSANENYSHNNSNSRNKEGNKKAKQVPHGNKTNEGHFKNNSSGGNKEGNKNKKPSPNTNKANESYPKNYSNYGKKEGNKNINPGPHANKTNDSNTNHRKGNNNVMTRIVANVDANAVREALCSPDQLPEKLRSALGSATLELNNRCELVVHKRDAGDWVNYNALRRMLQKNALPGWLEWLQGRRGWTLDTDKFPYLNYHRDLHEAYTTVMRALLKRADPDLRRYLVVLYYKPDPLTQENGGCPINGTRQNTQTLWKKVSEKESLQDAVGKLRPFLEVLRYFCTDPKEKWTTLPWLMPIVTREESQKRLARILELVKTLMRSSEWGPDVPVHWAAHPPLNHYPRSTITSDTMTELVVGTTNILSNLFLRYPITVDNLHGVDKILPKFSSWLDGSSSIRGEAKPKTTTTRTANEVEPLVIDLTGLSISDD